MLLSLCTFLSLCALSTQTLCSKSTTTVCTTKIPPPTCGKNEVLNPCASACSTEATCPLVLEGISKVCGTVPSNEKCRPRCECKPGFVRINGECVTDDNCCTGQNEEIVNCPANCDETCEGKPSADCKLFPCFKKGCRCKSGFVRDKNGVCIMKSKCEKPLPTCGNNEVLIICPPYCSTEDTCLGVIDGIPKLCGPTPEDYECKPSCECKSGFVRINGSCVSVENCCTGQNEEIVNCPAHCDETCEGKPSADCQLFPCFKKGCRCKSGFVRNGNGVCIMRSKCEVITTPKPTPSTPKPTPSTPKPTPSTPKPTPSTCTPSPKPTTTTCHTTKKPTCGKLERYTDRMPEKEPTCEDHSTVQCKVCRPGCECIPGCFRHHGKCIKAKDCKCTCTE